MDLAGATNRAAWLKPFKASVLKLLVLERPLSFLKPGKTFASIAKAAFSMWLWLSLDIVQENRILDVLKPVLINPFLYTLCGIFTA